MTASAIDLERFVMQSGTAFDFHDHDEHQLAWASEGVLMVDVGDRCWVLPPNLALWIPAGVEHATKAMRESVLRGIYLDPQAFPLNWADPTVVMVSPLVRHLIDHLDQDLPEAVRLRSEAVLADVLQPVGKAAFGLPLPTDPRARELADLLLAEPALSSSFDELAHRVGSSSRTLLRLLLAETGMTFNQWRAHARLQSAMALLADGEPVSRVAPQVGYANPSAFVAAFRRLTGHTPSAYFGRISSQP